MPSVAKMKRQKVRHFPLCDEAKDQISGLERPWPENNKKSRSKSCTGATLNGAKNAISS